MTYAFCLLVAELDVLDFLPSVFDWPNRFLIPWSKNFLFALLNQLFYVRFLPLPMIILLLGTKKLQLAVDSESKNYDSTGFSWGQNLHSGFRSLL